MLLKKKEGQSRVLLGLPKRWFEACVLVVQPGHIFRTRCNDLILIRCASVSSLVLIEALIRLGIFEVNT